ncbi:MAG: DUF4065 domain-containing protein [Bacilli bacterium]|nr:DUF4065 domain-containing protein [Bacilli bacterium]
MSINSNISLLRKKYGYTQDEIASKLGITRQTYIRFEKEDGELSTSQVQKIADIFGVDVTDLYHEVEDIDKFKDMLIYILLKFKDHGLPKTKLAKLLYLSDFTHFYNHFESISHVKYKCKDYGPLAEPFLEVINDMCENGEMHLEPLSEGAQMISLSKSMENNVNISLSKEEKEEIDAICEKWEKASSKELVNFTHRQKPWMACRPNEIIPYELILQEDPDNVF